MTTPHLLASQLRDTFWHLLCHRSELPQPGDFLKLDWLDQEVVVFNDNGELVVFDNLCPHRGTRFFTDTTGNGAITCPYHGWSYRAGSLHIPCREQYATDELRNTRLNTLQTDWCADFLFASIRPALLLDAQLGDTFNLLGALSFNICAWPTSMPTPLNVTGVSRWKMHWNHCMCLSSIRTAWDN